MLEYHEIMNYHGTYSIHVNDTNNLTTTVILECESGQSMTYLFSQRIDILESNAQKDNCGDSFNVYLESVDVAGNILVEQWLVYVDKSPPRDPVFISNCLLDHDVVSVLLNTCRVFCIINR